VTRKVLRDDQRNHLLERFAEETAKRKRYVERHGTLAGYGEESETYVEAAA